MSERTAVYRILGEDDELLYIGMTNNPAIRWNGHQRIQPWWNELRSMSVEWFDSREEAAAAEKAAIQSEEPKYNVTYLRRPGGSRLEVPEDIGPEEADGPDMTWGLADRQEYMDAEDVAGFLKVPVREINRLARDGGGPAFIMVGTARTYHPYDVHTWICGLARTGATIGALDSTA